MTYTISDLEQLSGIQSHTIRIWEQRYNALKPMRTEGNTRLYDDEQLVRLLNIVSLNQSGLKISKICSLSDLAVENLLNQQQADFDGDEQSEMYIAQLIKHGLAFNEIAFINLIDESISKVGILESYRKVIYPLLVRLGFMWRKNDICPAHEHFLSSLIRQKIFSAINSIPLNSETKSTWLLFLPEDEDHDIGLLFANYMLRMHNQKVVYLGSKVPLHSIEKVFKTIKIDHVLLFMVKSQMANNAQKFVDQLSAICSSAKICVAGNGQVIGKLKKNENIHWLKTLNEFEDTIQNQILS